MSERPNLDLKISGKGLMLSGSFGGWQSQLVLGPDLDDVGVCLFVDATSVGPSNDVGNNLFSFRSRSVEPVGKGKYRVLGDFTCADATRELAVDVETPLGHTPLIAVSFAAERKDFGSAWTSLVEHATILDGPAEGAGPQPESAAWMTPPHLAAA
jgi:polyisoprenoid-binding protein YceI